MSKNTSGLPPVTSFTGIEGFSRKRKRPDRDFIDELLDSDSAQNGKGHASKRSKKTESSSEIVKLSKSKANKENENTSTKGSSDLYRKTGGMVVKVSVLL